ncbi:Structural maintenance of chromosomes protein 2 [Mortierella sp. AM989]|nr:Structural maintenance of chromosomes protein 2 [Mortierella sp. AM989]
MSTVTRVMRGIAIKALQCGSIPHHVGFIMDGNRRYGQKVHVGNGKGYYLGYEALEETLAVCMEMGVKVVTVYAFSIENFKRPPDQVETLMELAKIKLAELCEHSELVDRYGIGIRVLGDETLLPEDVQELAMATRSLVGGIEAQELDPSDITTSVLENSLYTRSCPPMDILIRTSGEIRLSDFMLWQSSRACHVEFIDCYWPEFTFWKLLPILLRYQLRAGTIALSRQEYEQKDEINSSESIMQGVEVATIGEQEVEDLSPQPLKMSQRNSSESTLVGTDREECLGLGQYDCQAKEKKQRITEFLTHRGHLPNCPLDNHTGMRIEELIIDGFKSYATRTSITGWDPEFNAITGLNGSGKSNILDAICFVLGITNWAQVRASSIQDLIYKRGQAGVTKASVTVVFNNHDREQSPVGFESSKQITITRQILIGGRSKFLVNGHTAQQQVVQTLFQSVQLNINNPHFLIMQGKITKVLNMKPPEILSMIEEAAGTRMFEERKEKALKTIAKKEKKVAEITQLLSEEIVPKLDKLRGEKRAYLEFQKTQTEIERLSRIVVSYDYSRYEQRYSKSKSDLEARIALTDRKTAEIQQQQSAISNITQNIEIITANRLKEMTQGGKFQTLDATVKELSKEIVKFKTQRDLKGKEVEEEEQNRFGLEATQKETEKNLQEKRTEFQKLQVTYNEMKQKHDGQQEQVRMNEELIQTLSTGLAAEEGHENGYMEQLQRVKASAAQATTSVEQSKLKLKHLEAELVDKRRSVNVAQKNSKDLSSGLLAIKQQVKQLEDTLRRQTFDPEKERALLMEKAKQSEAASKLSEQIEYTSRRVSGLDFQYSNPTPNFDRSTVKGLVAELFNVLPENNTATTALEICAGGRLYNVVVDSEVIGSQLLQNGKLRKRVTIIPLNKISAFRAHAQKITTAQKLAPGKVNLALSLIGYEEHLETAMTYIFGNTLICADAESAKKVTFHQEVRMKSVTLDGDVYDPSGTLQGGSKPNGGGILASLQEMHALKSQLAEHRQLLNKVDQQLSSLSQEGRAYAELKQKQELKTHELRLCEQQISASEHVQLMEQVEKLEKEIEALKSAIQEGNVKKSEAVKRCQEIEKEMNDFKKNKDGKLQELMQKLAKSKAELVKNAPRVKAMQREYQTFELELEQLEKDIKAANQDLSESESTISNFKQERDRLQSQLRTLEASLEKAQAEFEREKAQLTAYDEELKELEALSKQKSKIVAESQLEIQNLAHETDRLSKENHSLLNAIQDLESAHDWIQDQKHLFGQPNGPYDFNSQNPSESRKKLKQLDEKHSAMKNKVNPKVMTMLENQEKREASLKQMLATVQRDKTKIEDTIVSLDDYKNEALERTYSKVNGDFGAIFGDLLPGNNAKLRPLEGQDVTGGLEVKVCLGGVWKASLTELSGGQRSLIALSLILSLLQFKPAPMYILDEVDAALDLSHTQNIGQLLRTRFKGSQFIVVSLKEGMFNNANVLFRARFRDGISIVDRNAQNQNRNAKPLTAASSHTGRRGDSEKENDAPAANLPSEGSTSMDLVCILTTQSRFVSIESEQQATRPMAEIYTDEAKVDTTNVKELDAIPKQEILNCHKLASRTSETVVGNHLLPKRGRGRPKKHSIQPPSENQDGLSLDPAIKIQRTAAMTSVSSPERVSPCPAASIDTLPTPLKTRGRERGKGRGRGRRRPKRSGAGAGTGTSTGTGAGTDTKIGARTGMGTGTGRGQGRGRGRGRGRGSSNSRSTIASAMVTRSSDKYGDNTWIANDEDTIGDNDDGDRSLAIERPGDPLTDPTSRFTESDMSEVVAYQSFVRLPQHVQDAFIKALPSVIKEQEHYVADGTVTEEFFTTCPAFSKALEGWQRALRLGKFTKQYASKYEVVKRSFETEAEWKSDNFEQYYGEKTNREKEKSMSPGKSSKVSLSRIGSMRGIQVGDRMRYRRTFDMKDCPEIGGFQALRTRKISTKRETSTNVKTRAKAMAESKREVETPETTIAAGRDAVKSKVIEVDMLMKVVSIKVTGKPYIQFELKRAPEEEGEIEAMYQERLASNPIYEVDTVNCLESLCLERDGRIPKAFHQQELDPCKYFDVIRGASLVGSLFAIRMDVYGKMQMDRARQSEIEGARDGNEIILPTDVMENKS